MDAEPIPKKRSTWKTVSVGLILLAVLGAIAIPNFVKARTTSCQNSCVNVLRQIDGAKEQWALEKKKTAGEMVTEKEIPEIDFYIKGGAPKCPAGGKLSYNAVDAVPTCSIVGHSI